MKKDNLQQLTSYSEKENKDYGPYHKYYTNISIVQMQPYQAATINQLSQK